MSIQNILISNEDGYHNISTKKILFVSTYDYISIFHLNDGQKIYCSKSLSNIMNILPNHFFRISRSSLVNLNEILSVKSKKRIIILSNSSELIISHRKIASLKVALAKNIHTLTC